MPWLTMFLGTSGMFIEILVRVCHLWTHLHLICWPPEAAAAAFSPSWTAGIWLKASCALGVGAHYGSQGSALHWLERVVPRLGRWPESADPHADAQASFVGEAPCWPRARAEHQFCQQDRRERALQRAGAAAFGEENVFGSFGHGVHRDFDSRGLGFPWVARLQSRHQGCLRWSLGPEILDGVLEECHVEEESSKRDLAPHCCLKSLVLFCAFMTCRHRPSGWSHEVLACGLRGGRRELERWRAEECSGGLLGPKGWLS